MKKTVVLFVLAVLVAGTAHAQKASCQRETTGKTAAEWLGMSTMDRERECLKALMPDLKPVPSMFQPPDTSAQWMLVQQETKQFSKPLMVAGALTVLAGVAMMLPIGENYYVLGDAYCVTEYSVDSGGCSSPSVKWGAVFAGAGAAMIAVGVQKVKVAPYWYNSATGVKVKIAWGGKK